jgi:tRNA (cytidine/uridine-2'-O-)-methyltransferase
VFRIAFHEPRIPPNTGNAIRMVAATGCELHLIGPLGFELSDAKLRRAGLDYHDLATVIVHENLSAAWQTFGTARVFAFTTHATRGYTEVAYRPGDVLLFGPEPTGLSTDVLADPHVTDRLRIPMLPGRRSLNLSNAAAVAAYEAWRQCGFAGGPENAATRGDALG